VQAERRGGAAARTAGHWLKDKDGNFSAARALAILLPVGVVAALAGALIVSVVEAGAWLTVLAIAVVNAVLVVWLVAAPLARGYEALLKARPRSGASPTIDSLTRVPNRRAITASLLEFMAYSGRYGHPLCVALVDLDLLREINRGIARKAGDKALQTVAAVLGDTLRMPDRAGRYGDEEFLVVLPNTTLKNAGKIAERIREGVETTDCSYGDKKIPVTVSIGVSQFRKGEDLETFLSRAEKALGTAKTSGRNRIVIERAA